MASQPTTIVAMLVWMDLEMTGLDPNKDTIVEIAVLVTDDNLQVVAEGPDLVISTLPELLADMEPVVREMHSKSGLLDAIQSSTITIEEAGRQVYDFIREYVPTPRSSPLCGNTIGTDRRFLAAYLPQIEEYLHYRSIDVSTLKELCRRWYPDILAKLPTKSSTHRALDDIRESIAELAFYRDNLFIPPVNRVL
ncbi:MAG: oligoribonuclease [Actinobacteria bacterium]|nr:oligoribonuclease [Actinomycetota bacterium]